MFKLFNLFKRNKPMLAKDDSLKNQNEFSKTGKNSYNIEHFLVNYIKNNLLF